MNRLSHKTAFITGASRGIGQEISKAFFSESANCYLLARQKKGFINEHKHLRQGGFIATCDIRNEQEVIIAINKDLNIGPIDIIVNCAGISGEFKPLEETTKEDIENLFATNVYGTMYVIKHLTPYLRDGGSIINISSIIGGTLGANNMSAYCATKGAVEGLTRALAVEYAPKGIRVNCIAPTITETKMVSDLFSGQQELKEKLLYEHPLNHFVDTKDVANMAVYLASDESRSVTGQVFKIDCGRSVDGK